MTWVLVLLCAAGPEKWPGGLEVTGMPAGCCGHHKPGGLVLWELSIRIVRTLMGFPRPVPTALSSLGRGGPARGRLWGEDGSASTVQPQAEAEDRMGRRVPRGSMGAGHTPPSALGQCSLRTGTPMVSLCLGGPSPRTGHQVRRSHRAWASGRGEQRGNLGSEGPAYGGWSEATAPTQAEPGPSPCPEAAATVLPTVPRASLLCWLPGGPC